MTNNKTLLEVSQNILTAGIFTTMKNIDTNQSIPFLHVMTSNLEADYYYNNSGGKAISPYVRRLLEDGNVDVLNSTMMTTLANTILIHSKDNWLHLISAFALSYQASQKHKETISVAGSDTTTHTGIDTDTRTPLTTTTTTALAGSNYEETDFRHHGFNSANASPVDNTKTSRNINTSVAETGSDTMTHTRGTTDTLSHGTTETREITPDVKELLESLGTNIDFWRNHDFLTLIYQDVDSILTSPVYL